MPVLLADIGGTNARFALLPPGAALPGPVAGFAHEGFPGIAEAIASWIEGLPKGQRPRAAMLAVAGPVDDNRGRLTNRGWVLDGAQLAPALGLEAVLVVNDFEALAWSLPMLPSEALRYLGGAPQGEADAPMLVLGPGTGLGVACLLPPPGRRVLASEGGHASLAAQDAHEAAAIEAMRPRFDGHVSAERGGLSGQGIEALHAALGGDPERSAPEITEAGVAGTDPICREAMAMFCAMLGGVAGSLALTFGARGGVFIGGGIGPRFPDFLAASAFRSRFEAKGRFRDWLAPVPRWLILHPHATLLGLAALARRG